MSGTPTIVTIPSLQSAENVSALHTEIDAIPESTEVILDLSKTSIPKTDSTEDAAFRSYIRTELLPHYFNPEFNYKIVALRLPQGLCGSDAEMEELLNAIPTNPSLREFDLAGNSISIASSVAGISALASLLARTPSVCKVHARIILNADADFTSYLSLEKISRDFAAHPLSLDLDLSQQRISVTQTAGIIRGLATGAIPIEALDLSDTMLDDRSLSAIAEGLKGNTTLKVLVISGSPQQTKFVRCCDISALAASLQDSALETLCLAHQALNADSISRLHEALPHAEKLVHLDLSDNPLGEKSIPHLVAMIETDKLRSLNLARTQLGAKGIKRIIEVVKDTRRLQRLDLSYNITPRDTEIFDLILKALIPMRIRELNIRGFLPASVDLSSPSFYGYRDIIENSLRDFVGVFSSQHLDSTPVTINGVNLRDYVSALASFREHRTEESFDQLNTLRNKLFESLKAPLPSLSEVHGTLMAPPATAVPASPPGSVRPYQPGCCHRCCAVQ
jgi:Ran GTPase-activating protein (RanGAP) involved in mRNA processing and transport